MKYCRPYMVRSALLNGMLQLILKDRKGIIWKSLQLQKKI